MARLRKLNRRSFLLRVAGGSVATGAIAEVSGGARAFQVTDADPTDAPGQGRGGARPQTGITDSDRGPGADPAGQGRGGTRPQPGITDSDTGRGADPVGQGRGPRPGSGSTGVTDRDAGANADPVGGGRGGSPTDEQRRQRCADGRSELQRLEVQAQRPEGWSDERLAGARADLGQISAAIAEIERQWAHDSTGYGRDRSMAAAAVTYRHIFVAYGLPRSTNLPWAAARIGDQVRRAEAATAQRHELHRRIAERRAALQTLDCEGVS